MCVSSVRFCGPIIPQYNRKHSNDHKHKAFNILTKFNLKYQRMEGEWQGLESIRYSGQDFHSNDNTTLSLCNLRGRL